ncbi:MAG TPA: glycosyltransferase [Phycisphaerae bacterium]|nr:glycosyltransferase [Phycisphaerae bacterium]
MLDELLDFVSVRIAALWPPTRRAWREATLLLVQNEETLRRLPASTHSRAKLLNHALFADIPHINAVERGSHILCLGSFETRKGTRLVVEALAHAGKDVRLVMVANEKGRKALLRRARQLGVADRVEFRDPVPRAQVFGLLAGAAAAVFTGLREEGGMTLAEALLSGTPVIVLANGGARTLAEAATDPDRVLLVEPSGVAETTRRIGKAMTQFSRIAPSSKSPMLNQKAAEAILHEAFEVVGRGRAEPKPDAPDLP